MRLYDRFFDISEKLRRKGISGFAWTKSTKHTNFMYEVFRKPYFFRTLIYRIFMGASTFFHRLGVRTWVIQRKISS